MLIGRTGGVVGKDFAIGDAAGLGASAENDIRVNVEGVSRRHARVYYESGSYTLEDLGSTNGTFVNGHRVKRAPLQHLDVVTLGRDVDLIFLQRERRPVPLVESVTGVSLEWIDGPEAGARVDVPRGEMTVGRAESCSIQIESAVVSKVHARLVRAADHVAVQDLGTVNGTQVNGKRIDGYTVLESQSVVTLAGTRSFRVIVKRAATAGPTRTLEPRTADGAMFDQDWRTRLIWSADELEMIQQEVAVLQAKRPAAAPPVSAPASSLPKPPSPPEVARAPIVGEGAGGSDPARTGHEGGPATRIDAGQARASSLPPDLVAASEAARSGGDQPAETAANLPGDASPGVPRGLARAAAAAREGRSDRSNVPTERAAVDLESTRAANRGNATASPDAPVDEAADSAIPGRIRAIRVRGNGTTSMIHLGRSIVGRGVGADVIVDEKDVSRRHAAFIVSEDAVTVEDLGSANGTSVNGQRLTAARILKSGDQVKIGTVELVVEIVYEENT